MAKSEAEVALEIYQSVVQSNEKQKRLKSSRFWVRFDVKARHKQVVERIESLLTDLGLTVAVKSGEVFGEERDDDWIVLTLKIKPPEPEEPKIQTKYPPQDWFQDMQAKKFESEREVETYFIAPLLEKLGYNYDDIVIGYPVEMFKGVQKIKTEADFVLFNGPGREKRDVLLIIEAKESDKVITSDHIGQAKSYSQELLPSCYVVTNGLQTNVFQFNGMLAPDAYVMDFGQPMLSEKWDDLYRYISKEATIKRKLWMHQNSEARMDQKKIEDLNQNLGRD